MVRSEFPEWTHKESVRHSLFATRQAEVPARDSCYPLPMFPPERIVCLTEETVETLYLLGEDHRIVGVSGYAVRPARVRREKPRVSAL